MLKAKKNPNEFVKKKNFYKFGSKTKKSSGTVYGAC